MKTSLETQKKIMFIPLVNYLNWFSWARNRKELVVSIKDDLIAMCVVMGNFLLFAFLYNIFKNLLPQFHLIFAALAVYFAPCGMGYGLVRLQEKLLCNDLSFRKKGNLDRKKGLIIAGVVISAVALICTISVVIIEIKTNFPNYKIEDINGDEDTSLAVITQDEVRLTNHSAVTIMSHFSGVGNMSNVEEDLRKFSHDKVEFSCKQMSGVMVLHATAAEINNLTLELSSRLSSGNMELLVFVDGEYYDTVGANSTYRLVLKDVAGKVILVKMAAESAEFEVTVTRMHEAVLTS